MLIIFLSVFLLACASARMAEEVQSGKATFDSGNFKLAFAQLLPLAVKCSPEAQYAVGYMYYYGLGVEAHKESGLFWISQSAAQMYRPAIKAMQLIEKERLRPQDPPLKKSNKLRYSENSLNESLKDPELQKKIAAVKKANIPQENPVRMAAKVTPENKEDEVLMSLRDIKPVKKTKVTVVNKDKFTLQLFGSYKLDDVKQLQSRLKLQHTTHYALTQHHGRDWYVLTYGKYPAVSLAKLGLADIPKKAQKLNPWIRNTSELRWVG